MPAIWRAAAAKSDDAVHQADRMGRFYDDCVADREQVLRSTQNPATPQIPCRSVACPAIWRAAAAKSDDAVQQADRLARVHDDCVADREQARTSSALDTDSGKRHKSLVGAWLARDLARSGSRIG
ncbi:hypothetical protein [Pseudomonas sp. F3-2]|uniref:hypothetical protein n=1 Tax=Pseudomonas sp. F3-2 TaxID=3141539 RepID=UPI00315D5B80